MNTIATFGTGLQTMIARLQQEKDELSYSYKSAITNGEKYESIKNIYLTLQDVEKKLRDLMRVNFTTPTISE